eukprot:GHUV01053363.1.p1 GENE.GHUV01053363.1~~GHUV01053363.1.p1  ORF type:complete len:126 (+),score=10.24 GHUV01053363.1:600-977(+)
MRDMPSDMVPTRAAGTAEVQRGQVSTDRKGDPRHAHMLGFCCKSTLLAGATTAGVIPMQNGKVNISLESQRLALPAATQADVNVEYFKLLEGSSDVSQAVLAYACSAALTAKSSTYMWCDCVAGT